MIARRYRALSLIPLTMLLLGLAALGLPEPLRGPLVTTRPVSPGLAGGLNLLSQPLYLADAIGLVMLALAILEVWVIGITWEYRRQRH